MELQVSTALLLDTAATNLIELGHPVLITITNSQNVDCAAAFQDRMIHNTSDSSKLKPPSSLPTVTVTGKKTGHKACSNVTMISMGRGVHLVKFEPKVSDNYSLNVHYKGEHIKGSPFTIKAVEIGALNGHWNSEQSPIVSIGESVNLVIPEGTIRSHNHEHATEGGRKLRISVRNSLGVCESSVGYLPHLNSIAIRFTPDIESRYYIKATLDDSAHETTLSKIFVLQANSPDDQANHCFIYDKDVHVFQKPLNFCDSPLKFQISTQKVIKRVSDKLDVFCQGLSRAVVKIISDDSSPGLDVCEVTPSLPGKYRIDIFWGGKPIRGNPFYLNFKPSQRCIVGSGLNLEQESFRIGIPYRFRLNCSDLGQGEIKISCHPPSVADISVKQVHNDKRELFHQCQVIPRQIGQHELHIKYNGHHIEESPCTVHFKPRGDASKCCMVSSSNFHQVGGDVSFQISTSGSSEGKLIAIVEEVASNKHTYSRGAFPVETKQLSPELYEIQFNPGTMSECLLSVMYDDNHISGSPFKMSFCEANRCEASGEGLMLAQVGMWNRFIVSSDHAGPGALLVVIESGSGERVDPIITRLTPTLLEVRYRPLVPGNYSIALQWGQIPIPGSPFQVKCFSPVMCLSVTKPPPAEMPLGFPIGFKVHSTGSGIRYSGLLTDDLSVVAANYLGERFKGKVELDKSSGEFDCRVVPPSRGKYKINIKWKGDHIRGSPFNINVIAPPLPENICVHCFKTSVVVRKESRFWIDTSKAGPGLLSISVHGNQPFQVHSSSDPHNPWTIESHFCPTHVGDYIIDMRWSGEHITGSPFTLTVTDREEEESVAVGGASDCCCAHDDENFQEGVTFF